MHVFLVTKYQRYLRFGVAAPRGMARRLLRVATTLKISCTNLGMTGKTFSHVD
jgi:hypothetical protein